ncbi:MAG: hypothetical protein V1913_14340 [Fibrobacterota bacterium]
MIKQTFFFALALTAFVSARTIELFYTEDGKTLQSLRGVSINEDYTLSNEGDQSWLVNVGQKFGPNGYVPKESRLTLGTLGKSRSLFITQSDDFLGFGHGRRFEHAIKFDDIAWIVPDTQAFAPLHVMLTDGTDGDLFVASDYTESPGRKLIAGKPDNSIVIIQMKYNVPASQRTPSTMPQQFGIKARAVSFSEQGLRRALRKLNLQ